MNCRNLNNQFFACKFGLLLLVIMFTLSINNAAGQKKNTKKEKHFEVEVSFATIYDNNILKYSDKYLERFMNNEDEGRFHIDTYDDIILYQSLNLDYTFRIFKNLKSKVNFDFFNNAYAINGIKNWYFVSIGFQQYFSKRGSFKILYSYIPSFYVRHFRDDDWVAVYGYTPETFVPFGFSKNNYGFWIQNTFYKNTRVRLAIDYSTYYYNKHYTEYDSKNFIYGISVYQPLSEDLKLEIGYQYLTSDAKGYDQAGESKATSDDSDASYKGHGFRFGCTLQLPRIKKLDNDLDVQFELQKRYYSSAHYLEMDPEHVGRMDNNFEINATYGIKLHKSWRLAAFYYYFFRNTTTTAVENQDYLSAEKDYRQGQVGLKVTYNLKF